MSREAMQMALEALDSDNPDMQLRAAIALRQALQTEQEPFEYWNAVEGWVQIDEVREHFNSVGCGTIYKSAAEGRTPLYTTPPKQWVGLTLNEAEDFYEKYTDRAELINAIDKFLEEKNT